jgi:hypothetical protein
LNITSILRLGGARPLADAARSLSICALGWIRSSLALF